jgi:hypothetical protein
MTTTHSVRDVLTHLTKVLVVEVDGKDVPLSVTRQTQTVIDKLEVPITKNLGLQGISKPSGAKNLRAG